MTFRDATAALREQIVEKRGAAGDAPFDETFLVRGDHDAARAILVRTVRDPLVGLVDLRPRLRVARGAAAIDYFVGEAQRPIVPIKAVDALLAIVRVHAGM